MTAQELYESCITDTKRDGDLTISSIQKLYNDMMDAENDSFDTKGQNK